MGKKPFPPSIYMRVQFVLSLQQAQELTVQALAAVEIVTQSRQLLPL